jgi:hypothetical protein
MPVSDVIARILRKRQSYRRTFNVEDRDVQRVLADLRRFCGAERPVYRVSPVSRMVDPNATLVAAGKLEVWQRIERFLQMTDADLANLQDHEEAKHD